MTGLLGLTLGLPGPGGLGNPEAGSASTPPPLSALVPPAHDAPAAERPCAAADCRHPACGRADPAAPPRPARFAALARDDSALALPAPAPRPAASLAEATAKLMAKVSAKKSKAQARIAAAEAKIAAKQAASAQHAADLVVDQELLALVEGFLELAQQDLVDAQALPEGTPQQLEAKQEAVAHAELGVKLATKEVAAAAKAVAKHEQAIVKLDAQVETLQGKVADLEDFVSESDEQLAFLAAPFDFDPTAPRDVGVLVSSGGEPVVGAHVALTNPLGKPKGKPPADRGTPWWSGVTDADGRVDVTLRLPESLEQLDLVVDADGLSGEWTWPGHAERAGIFAPSARVTLDVAALADHDVLLVEDSP